MGNPYSLYVNRPVSYRTTVGWCAAHVATITNQDNVTLYLSNTTLAQLVNGGVAVPRKGSASAAGAEVNTWRPY